MFYILNNIIIRLFFKKYIYCDLNLIIKKFIKKFRKIFNYKAKFQYI